MSIQGSSQGGSRATPVIQKEPIQYRAWWLMEVFILLVNISNFIVKFFGQNMLKNNNNSGLSKDMHWVSQAIEHAGLHK